jgi:hypothetical protein
MKISAAKERSVVHLLGALAFFSVVGLSPAYAVTVGTTLPDAVSSEKFSFPDQTPAGSTTVGTLDYVRTSCAGTCRATTQLGSSPSASITAGQTFIFGMDGGSAQANLGYYVEYVDAPGTYDINLHATDTLSAPGQSKVSAHLRLGQGGSDTGALGNFISTAFEEADCGASGCAAAFNNNLQIHAFSPDNTVQMDANTLYYVELNLTITPAADGIATSGMIDPTFSGGSPTGHFIFSPGVSAVAPIPATLPLFATSLAGLGVIGWRRKKPASAQ